MDAGGSTTLDLANPDTLAFTLIGPKLDLVGGGWFGGLGDEGAGDTLPGARRDEDENVRCKEMLPLLRLMWFANAASAGTAVFARCCASGDAGTEAEVGLRSNARPLTADVGGSPVLMRADTFLNGDGARDGGVEPVGDGFTRLPLAIELETLRPVPLFSLALGRIKGGDRELPKAFVGEAGRDAGGLTGDFDLVTL